MGGHMEEFCLSEAEREQLAAVFKRGRDPGTVQRFIDQVERATTSWLKREPWNTAARRTRAKEYFNTVGRKAFELLQAMQRLDDHELSFGFFATMADHMAVMGVDGRKLRVDSRETVERIRNTAEILSDWQSPPPHKVASERLFEEIARLYVAAFGVLPSANPDSQFLAFCDEFAAPLGRYLPPEFKFVVSRPQVEAWRQSEKNRASPLY